MQIDIDLDTVGKDHKNNWTCSKDLEETYDNADAIVILTEWDDYKKIDWFKVDSKLRSPAWVFDTRKIVNPREVETCNFNFWQVGMGNM